MDETQETRHYPSFQQRYAGYDRIMGNISWLLIALVTLDIKLMPTEHASLIFLAAFCVLLFFYNINARYGVLSRKYSPFKTFVDLMVFLAFIVAVCWYTGRITSPFMSLIYLILMATSLTQGKRVTYFMAVLAISSYILLASDEFKGINDFLTHTLELFPFMLIAHLGAMLAGETESARREVERLSLTDEVTGINNMRNFFIVANAQEKLSKRYNRPYAICMIDADNLKKINDQSRPSGRNRTDPPGSRHDRLHGPRFRHLRPLRRRRVRHHVQRDPKTGRDRGCRAYRLHHGDDAVRLRRGDALHDPFGRSGRLSRGWRRCAHGHGQCRRGHVRQQAYRQESPDRFQQHDV